MQFILASQSPRRKELLEKIIPDFLIEPAGGEEVLTNDHPSVVVQKLAQAKAKEVSKKHEGEDVVIIGADTIVVQDGMILGKPKDAADMRRMMDKLQGNCHSVYTGVAIVYLKDGKWMEHLFVEETKVYFYPMSEAQLDAYALDPDGLDKAGGYGIQSKATVYVKAIEGEYNTVVGLPVARLYHELCDLGIAN